MGSHYVYRVYRKTKIILNKNVVTDGQITHKEVELLVYHLYKLRSIDIIQSY